MQEIDPSKYLDQPCQNENHYTLLTSMGHITHIIYQRDWTKFSSTLACGKFFQLSLLNYNISLKCMRLSHAFLMENHVYFKHMSIK